METDELVDTIIYFKTCMAELDAKNDKTSAPVDTKIWEGEQRDELIKEVRTAFICSQPVKRKYL